MMEYKGYFARVEFDDELEIFHGDVVNLRDVITFQSTTVKGLKKAFKDSIDDYLAFCKERGEDPDKTYSGRFVVRIEPELHKSIAVKASQTGESLNQWVQDQLKRAVG